MLFKAADQTFEDERLSQEEWQTRKPNTPFKHIPVLEYNGKVLSESHAIERFLAAQLGLNGNGNFEAAQVDIVVEWMEDVKTNYRKIRALPAADQPAAKTKFFTEDLVQSAHYLETYLGTLGHAGPFVVGHKLSLADITLGYNFTSFWDDAAAVKAAISKCPKIQASVNACNNDPKIAKWLKDRPNSQF